MINHKIALYISIACLMISIANLCLSACVSWRIHHGERPLPETLNFMFQDHSGPQKEARQ